MPLVDSVAQSISSLDAAGQSRVRVDYVYIWTSRGPSLTFMAKNSWLERREVLAQHLVINKMGPSIMAKFRKMSS